MTAGREVKYVDEEDRIVQMLVREELQDPKLEYGVHSTQHVPIQRADNAISRTLAIWLRGWNCVTSLMLIVGCIFTFFLLTKHHPVATVLIRTVLMCGQMRTVTPLSVVTSNCVSVSVWSAVLDDKLICPFIFKLCLTGIL
jgi:hypothetical protein